MNLARLEKRCFPQAGGSRLRSLQSSAVQPSMIGKLYCKALNDMHAPAVPCLRPIS